MGLIQLPSPECGALATNPSAELVVAFSMTLGDAGMFLAFDETLKRREMIFPGCFSRIPGPAGQRLQPSTPVVVQASSAYDRWVLTQVPSSKSPSRWA